MIPTVTTSTATARTTRRHTWRSGVLSRCARCTPLCGSSSARSRRATPRRVSARAAPPTAQHARSRPAGGLPLAGGQLPLEHLAGRGDWDGVDEDDVAQPLVVHDLVVDRAHHRLGRERGAGVVGLAGPPRGGGRPPAPPPPPPPPPPAPPP